MAKDSKDNVETVLNVLEELLSAGKASSAEQQPYFKSVLKEFVNQAEGLKDKNIKDPLAFVNFAMAQIDEKLQNQVNEILHAPEFQKLEASWLGLHFLVMNSETGSSLKIRLMNISKKELLDDLDKAIEFDQSALFKKVYEEEYGTYGGSPFSCLVGDFEFGRHPQDMELLLKISQVAAAAHAPFISAASAKLFDLHNFGELGLPRDLSKIFESSELAKWRSFREMEDSRYAVLTLPHILMRLPYGENTVPVEGMAFEEAVDGPDNSLYCWGNSAYALAQRVNNAFAQYGWTAAIRGVEGGGLVEGLPAYTFKTVDGDVALKCPTEVAITDRREKELSDLGFISLCHCKGTDYACFFGGQTIQKPKKFNIADITANSEISARLPYILAASRFAHYIKVMMRDKIGSFMTKGEVAAYLNNWIGNYVLLNDEAPQSMKAKYPLREARVDVMEVPGKPGSYTSVIYLRPHFQLEEFDASIRLVAKLPDPAGG